MRQTGPMNERRLIDSGSEKISPADETHYGSPAVNSNQPCCPSVNSFAIHTKTVTVDVREDIRSGREPFSKIMKAVAALLPDERLLLLAPFEPEPLFRVMEKQGFAHTERATASGDWEIFFTQQANPEAMDPTTSVPAGAGKPASTEPAQIVEVDARGLEPPQPMVKILEALSLLAAGAALRAWTDRRPLHLYPHLNERGFAATTEEQPDGSFFTYVRHV